MTARTIEDADSGALMGQGSRASRARHASLMFALPFTAMGACATQAQEGAIGPRNLDPLALVALMEKTDWGPKRRFFVDLGRIIVCDDPPAAPEFMTLEPTRLFVETSREKVVHADLLERKYLALAKERYLVVTEGASLEPAPKMVRRKSRNAGHGVRRTVFEPYACLRAHEIDVALGPGAKPLNDSDDATYASFPVFSVGPIRIRQSYRVAKRDIIADKVLHYRVIEFEFAPHWNDGYARIARDLGGMKTSARIKAIAVIGCGVPETGRRDRCVYETVDRDEAPADEAFAKLPDRAAVMTMLESKIRRAHQKR